MTDDTPASRECEHLFKDEATNMIGLACLRCGAVVYDIIADLRAENARLKADKARTIEAWGTESREKSKLLDEWMAEYRSVNARARLNREEADRWEELYKRTEDRARRAEEHDKQLQILCEELCNELGPKRVEVASRRAVVRTDAGLKPGEEVLSFRQFQERNRARCESPNGFRHRVAWDEPKWPLQNWALAVAGEAGELCNLVKKCIRGDFTIEEKREEILAELADVMTYCDLAISSLGADTSETIMAKFEAVSKRIGYAALKTGEGE